MKTLKTKISALAFIALIICLLSTSCNQGINNSAGNGKDTVEVQIKKLSDSSSFVRENGDQCMIFADATISVPIRYHDAESIAKLRELFAHQLLDTPDSLTVDMALQQSVNRVVNQYKMTNGIQETDSTGIGEELNESVKCYNYSTTISVYYNKNDILTFCKVDVVKKDNKVTSITHKYYNFDLEKMALIDLGSLFRDDCLAMVSNDLKQQLISDNKVSTEDQLNELGFYNIDNFSLTRNFYFGDDGITWSFLPNELAVEALGEPSVTLDFESLESYLSDSSIIKRLD